MSPSIVIAVLSVNCSRLILSLREAGKYFSAGQSTLSKRTIPLVSFGTNLTGFEANEDFNPVNDQESYDVISEAIRSGDLHSHRMLETVPEELSPSSTIS